MTSRLASGVRLPIGGSQPLTTTVAGVATALWVGVTVIFPVAALPPLGVVVASLLIASSVFRLGFVLVVGMLVLNTTQDFNLIKVGYLLGVGIAVAGASLSVLRSFDSTTHKVFSRLVGASLLFSVVVAISWPVAAMNGTPATSWLRDAAPYFLFGLVPILALDAQSVPRRLVTGMLIGSGVLSATSFAIEVLYRHSYADLPFSHVAFESLLLPAALFCYALAAALKGRRARLTWSLLAACIFTLLTVTGTRSNLLLLVSPIAILILGQSDSIRRWTKALAYGLVTFGLVLVFVPTVAGLIGADVTEVTGRFGSIFELVRNPTQDLSYQQRVQQTSEAWQVLISNPILGVGPGHLFQGRTAVTNLPLATYNIDTGISFPAKFGFVGLGAASLVAAAFAGVLWSGRRTLAWSVPFAAMLGYFPVVLVSSVLISPFEDKGLSFGLLLLLALYGIDRRRSDQAVILPSRQPLTATGAPDVGVPGDGR